MQIKQKAYFFLILLFSSCANMLAPTGGPQDAEAPKVLKSNPRNNQINYKKSEIRIEFDEYVTVENFSKEVLISPPLENPPEHKLSKRTMIVKWTDTLRMNTTYTFMFGSSIKDVNEANVLENLTLTFSTGPDIDSANYEGNIITIDKKEPLKGAFVYLTQEEFYDSLFFPVHAQYVTKTNSEGKFIFQGLKPGDYNLFFLEDKNSNKMPDNGEYVGFSYEKITVSYPEIILPEEKEESTEETEEAKEETKEKDEEHEKSKGQQDTLNQQDINKPSKKPYQAFPYFSPEKKYFKSVNSSGKEHITLMVQDNIYPKNLIVKEEEDTLFSYQNGDTVFAFIPEKKSLLLQVFTSFGDTLLVSDTIAMLAKASPPQIFSLPDPLTKREAKTVFFKANRPIVNIDTSRVSVKHSDSVELEFEVLRNNKGFEIIPNVEAPQTIEITFKDSFIQWSDTLFSSKLSSVFKSFPDPKNLCNYEISFNRKSEEFQQTPLVILLEKGEQKQFFYLTENDTLLILKNIEGGSYSVKVFADKNGNGLWDTGDIINFIKPEPFFKLPNTIEVKEGWDGDAEVVL